MIETRISVCQQLILLALLIVLTFIPATTQAAQGNGIQIQLQSSPSVDAIRPDHDVAQISILANDENGQPVKDVELSFTLTGPAKKFFPSTDFPIVEGTILMKSKVLLPEGKLDFKYVFPIRGVYALKVIAVPTANPGQAVEKTMHISFNENPLEVRNAIVFILGLFFFGLITGYMLTTRRVAKEVV